MDHLFGVLGGLIVAVLGFVLIKGSSRSSDLGVDSALIASKRRAHLPEWAHVVKRWALLGMTIFGCVTAAANAYKAVADAITFHAAHGH